MAKLELLQVLSGHKGRVWGGIKNCFFLLYFIIFKIFFRFYYKQLIGTRRRILLQHVAKIKLLESGLRKEIVG